VYWDLDATPDEKGNQWRMAMGEAKVMWS